MRLSTWPRSPLLPATASRILLGGFERLNLKPPTLRALRQAWLGDAERQYLVRLVEESPAIRDAAKRAGVSAATLYRLLRRHRIRLKTVAVSESR